MIYEPTTPKTLQKNTKIKKIKKIKKHDRSSQEPEPGARTGPVPGSGPGPGFSQEAQEVPRRIPGYYRLLPIACRLLHIACCHIVLYLYVYIYIYIYIYIFNCSTGRLHACLMHRLPHQEIPSSLTRVMALIPLLMHSPHPT